MSQFKKRASAVLVAIALTTMAACAATPTTESTGEYVDDAAITAKVKARILDEPGLRSFDIHVDTFKGTVHLRGVAATQSSIDKALEVVRGVDGVRSVKNEMRVM
jgi:osmotically-inducible protein OsmY